MKVWCSLEEPSKIGKWKVSQFEELIYTVKMQDVGEDISCFGKRVGRVLLG